MRLPVFVLLPFMALCPAIALAQATLNKCTDAQGSITYSNTPCDNARVVKKLEIDPPPVPDPPPIAPALMPPAAPTVSSAPSSNPAPATLRLETLRTPKPPAKGISVQRGGGSQCDTFANKLGSMLDKMDQARRKGYTQAQMDGWNEKVRELERKKQQSGCF